MNVRELKILIEKYQKAEQEILDLDDQFGICLYNSKDENFYNAYNYIILKLFEKLFGEYGREVIEKYMFDQTDMTFDELCLNLGIDE